MPKRVSAAYGVGLAIAVAGFGGHAFADDRGSMEDQMACTPDVYRLCSSYVPDEDAIVGCLKRNLPSLSAACHRVFTRPDSPASNGGNEEDN